MKKNDRYKNKSVKTYDDLKDFLEEIVSFTTNDNYNDIIKNINYDTLKDNRVWTLFGSNDNVNWDCLQVAQKKNKMQNEIKCDIKFMFDSKYTDLLSEINKEDKIIKNTTFYDNAYEVKRDSDWRKFSYSKMRIEYVHFRICLLKIDDYLSLTNLELDNNNLINILEIAKPLYAEAKFAYETLSKYWNMYNSGVDGQAIMIFLEKDKQ